MPSLGGTHSFILERKGAKSYQDADGGGHDVVDPHNKVLSLLHPGDNIRANGASQKRTRPGMPPDSGGILRGGPRFGGAIALILSPGWYKHSTCSRDQVPSMAVVL